MMPRLVIETILTTLTQGFLFPQHAGALKQLIEIAV